MNMYFYLSKIALSISSSGNVDADIYYRDAINLSDVKNSIELVGVLLIVHKKRYLKCFTDEQRDAERRALTSNYNYLFDGFLESFLDKDVLLAIFDFITCVNLRSTQFREICMRLIELASQFRVQIIKNAVFSKLMRIIIGLGLYGEEPFDFILGRCIEFVDCDDSSGPYNFTFLE